MATLIDGLWRKFNLSRFLIEKRGNLTVMAAIAIVPLLASGGMAIDYLRDARSRSDLQAALDATVLYSVSKSAVFDAKRARAMFDKDAAGVEAKVMSFSIVQDATGEVTATAKARIEGSFIAILGKSQLGITVTSSAKGITESQLDTVTFQMSNAQCAFDQDIYFITRDKNGKVTAKKVLQYNYS